MVPGYPPDRASFQRQFERDKTELREMGMPLDTIEVPGTYPPVTGYRIQRDQAVLRDPGLEPDELAALRLAASAVRLEGIEGSGGLWKLGGEVAADDPPSAGTAPAATNTCSRYSSPQLPCQHGRPRVHASARIRSRSQPARSRSGRTYT